MKPTAGVKDHIHNIIIVIYMWGRDDWSAVTPVTGFLAPIIQWRPPNGRAQVTRDRGGGGVNFIYSSRVRYSHPRSSRPVSTSHAIYRSLPSRLVPAIIPLSRSASIYLFIYIRVSHSSATPPPIWYIIYTSRMIYISLSFRIVSGARTHCPAGYRGIFGFFFFYTWIYIYENHVTTRVPFLTIQKFIVFERVRFSSL